MKSILNSIIKIIKKKKKIEKDNDLVKKNSNSNFCTHKSPSNH